MNVRNRLFSWVGITLVVAVVTSLPGCRHRETGSSAAIPPAVFARGMMVRAAAGDGPGVRDGKAIAYRYDLSFLVSDGMVTPHFERARTYCLKTSECSLISAQQMAHEGEAGDARITLRLPHRDVAAFLALAASPLPGETGQKIHAIRQSVDAEDLAPALRDVARRIVQLTAYRDRLEVLEKQSAARAEDLIRVAKELSEVQSELESIQGQESQLRRRVDTEEIDLTYTARLHATGPLREAWREMGRDLLASAADVLTFVMTAIPWLPLVLLGLVFIRLALRRGWFRPGP